MNAHDIAKKLSEINKKIYETEVALLGAMEKLAILEKSMNAREHAIRLSALEELEASGAKTNAETRAAKVALILNGDEAYQALASDWRAAKRSCEMYEIERRYEMRRFELGKLLLQFAGGSMGKGVNGEENDAKNFRHPDGEVSPDRRGMGVEPSSKAARARRYPQGRYRRSDRD